MNHGPELREVAREAAFFMSSHQAKRLSTVYVVGRHTRGTDDASWEIQGIYTEASAAIETAHANDVFLMALPLDEDLRKLAQPVEHWYPLRSPLPDGFFR